MALSDILYKVHKETQELDDTQKKDLAFVEKFYTTGIEARKPFERQWYLNMAFFLGKQWVTWNTSKGQLEEPPAPSYRVRLVANRIMPTVLHIVAKLSQNRPVYKVVPNTAESEALNDALVSEKVLHHHHQLNSQDSLNQDLFMLNSIYGTAFKYPFFDAFAGEHLPKKLKTEKITTLEKNPKTGKEETTTKEVPITDDDGKEQFYDVYEGEVKEDVLDPFSIIPESGAEDLEHSQRVMKLTSKSIEYIRERYKNGIYVQAEPNAGVSSIDNQLKKLMSDQHITKSVSDARGKKDSGEGFAILKELREKPSHKYPKGRQIIVANHVLLHSGDLPYKFQTKRNTLGIVMYCYIKVPGRFWGKTPIEDLIPIQIEINKTKSQIIEIKNLMSKPKWIAFKESGISETAITSEPGEVIQPKFVPNVPEPHIIAPPSLSNIFSQELDRGNQDIEEIGLIHEVSKGTSPPGIRSGVAISMLQEKDQTAFAPIIARFESQEGKSGTYLLELTKEKYSGGKVLKIMGEDSEIEVFDFLAKDNMPTDVQVVTGSALPQSQTARQQLVLQYFQGGLFGDPQDEAVRRRALTLARMGGLDTLYKDIAADEKKAERENRMFERGDVRPIDTFDAHNVHISIHDLFRKTDTYMHLRQEQPKVAEMIEAHVTDHIINSAEAKAQKAEAEARERNTKAVEESMRGELIKDLAQAKYLNAKTEGEATKASATVLAEIREEEDKGKEIYKKKEKKNGK